MQEDRERPEVERPEVGKREAERSGSARSGVVKSSRRRPAVIAIAAAALILASIGIGYIIGRTGGPAEMAGTHEPGGGEYSRVIEWTCSMHPQIRQPKPGQCPLCGMDLIPVADSEGDEATGPTELRLSAKARKLAEIQTSPVERREVTAEVRMVGKVDYDETRVSYITAWVPGRLDRLHVNFTGVEVKRGDPMLSLYSPELLAAQEELLQAVATVRSLEDSDVSVVKRTAAGMVEATREKLRLWGFTPGQIEEIEERGVASDHMTIFSPASGVVVQKSALEGEYVKTGARIYTIADLSTVWVMLDAYESDLQWVRSGQEVEFQAEAFPGETFTGKIEFIDPVLDPSTRTARVRVSLANPRGKLKPEMFVRAVVKAGLRARPGEESPLVIPASAPLITGRRSVVYVEKEPGLYEGREVVLGRRAGDYYIVEEGLAEGERVVTQGNFKIDSAIQILARPSMMNPEGGGPVPGHDHGAHGAVAAGHEVTQSFRTYEAPDEFKSQIDGVFEAYLKIHHALSHDDHKAGKAAAGEFGSALDATDMMLLKEPAHSAWMKELAVLEKSAAAIEAATDIDGARDAFKPLSDAMYATVKQFGTGGKQPVYRFLCSMAFDNTGAHWLQATRELENPYWGSMMFRCGEMTETLIALPAHDDMGASGKMGEHGHE